MHLKNAFLAVQVAMEKELGVQITDAKRYELTEKFKAAIEREVLFNATRAALALAQLAVLLDMNVLIPAPSDPSEAIAILTGHSLGRLVKAQCGDGSSAELLEEKGGWILEQYFELYFDDKKTFSIPPNVTEPDGATRTGDALRDFIRNQPTTDFGRTTT